MSEKKMSNKLIETKDLLFVWKLIQKNLGIVIIVPILAYLVGYVYAYRMSNVYGARAELLLKQNDTYDYQDQLYKGLGAYGVYMDVQNQMRILSSRDLIGGVIDKIDINTSYFIVGRIKKNEVFETGPFRSVVEVENEQVYEQPIKIEILDTVSYRLIYQIDGQPIEVVHDFDKPLDTEHFNLELLRRYKFDKENIETLRSSDYEVVFHSRKNLIDKYQSHLQVSNIEHTSVLEVYLTDGLSKRAKVFLDTLTHSYVEYSEDIQIEVNENTLKNIEKQIDTISAKIQEKEEELLSYQSDHAILNFEKDGEKDYEELILTRREKREIERKIGSSKALLEYLKDSDDDRVLPPSFYIEKSDPYLTSAVSKIREKQIDIEIRKTHLEDVNINIKNLKNEINMLKSDIRDYLKNLMVALEREKELINQDEDLYRSRVAGRPRSAQDISNIQRELDVNNQMYLFLLEKKTNTQIARAGIIPQVRIIQETVSLGVVEPDKTKIKRLFVLGGVILAILIALIRKLFFEKITTVAALSEVSGMNIIGGIPFVKSMERQVVVDINPKSNVTESFRTIRTNLSYMGDVEEGDAKKILVSSFYPSEGKTMCSSNLATIISKGDKKVLLIDFDLHRPSLQKVCQVPNDKGVSNVLIGKSTIDEVLIKDFKPNLDVMTAGPVSPNPSELILRKGVQELFEWAEEEYDFIIIDTPPFGLLNDTNELIQFIDIYLVILNTKYTRRRGLEHIESILNKYDDISTGVILNNIKVGKLQRFYSKYSYKYSYGYSYGYGYGYDSSSYSSDYTEE